MDIGQYKISNLPEIETPDRLEKEKSTPFPSFSKSDFVAFVY